MFTTYILYSKTINKYYTGHTADFERRFGEHNRGKTSFLASGIPWIKIFSADFASRSEAALLESKIKKRGAKRFLSDSKLPIG